MSIAPKRCKIKNIFTLPRCWRSGNIFTKYFSGNIFTEIFLPCHNVGGPGIFLQNIFPEIFLPCHNVGGPGESGGELLERLASLFHLVGRCQKTSLNCIFTISFFLAAASCASTASVNCFRGVVMSAMSWQQKYPNNSRYQTCPIERGLSFWWWETNSRHLDDPVDDGLVDSFL